MRHTAFFYTEKGKLTSKPHVCENQLILDMVLADLKKRGVLTQPSIMTSEALPFLDYGGVMIEGTRELQAVGIAFFPHHYACVKRAFQAAIEVGERKGYFKIHANRAICLSPETFHKTSAFLLLNDMHFQEMAIAAKRDLNERIAKLQ